MSLTFKALSMASGDGDADTIRQEAGVSRGETAIEAGWGIILSAYGSGTCNGFHVHRWDNLVFGWFFVAEGSAF